MPIQKESLQLLATRSLSSERRLSNAEASWRKTRCFCCHWGRDREGGERVLRDSESAIVKSTGPGDPVELKIE